MANKNVKEVNVKIEGKDWTEALDKAFQKANSKAKIDGFRPGHAPKEVFLKKYGVEAVLDYAKQYYMLKDAKESMQFQSPTILFGQAKIAGLQRGIETFARRDYLSCAA